MGRVLTIASIPPCQIEIRVERRRVRMRDAPAVECRRSLGPAGVLPPRLGRQSVAIRAPIRKRCRRARVQYVVAAEILRRIEDRRPAFPFATGVAPLYRIRPRDLRHRMHSTLVSFKTILSNRQIFASMAQSPDRAPLSIPTTSLQFSKGRIRWLRLPRLAFRPPSDPTHWLASPSKRLQPLNSTQYTD